MLYQGNKEKFTNDNQIYRKDEKGTCADIHCNNEILIPSYGLDARSKQRFCVLCRRTKFRLGATKFLIWKCLICENILSYPEFNTTETKCDSCKRKRK